MDVSILRVKAVVLSVLMVAGLQLATPAAARDTDPAYVDPPVLKAEGRTSALVHVHSHHPLAAGIDAARRAGLELGTTYRPINVFVAYGDPGEFRALATDPGIEAIEANRRLRYFTNTSHTATRGKAVLDGDVTTPDGDIIDGSGVGVAVVDSGIDGTHPDFAGRIGNNVKIICTTPQFVAIGNGILPFEECRGPKTAVPLEDTDSASAGGHGTHVAGIVGGDGTASDGVFHGAAPGSTLFGVSVGTVLTVENALDGLAWVLENHDQVTPAIRVVNNSWGSGHSRYDPENAPFHKATWKLQEELVGAGVSVVFAAGNSGGNGNSATTGGECVNPTPGIICVANYNDGNNGGRNGSLSSTSSRGHRDQPDTWPDVSAPGTSIVATCRAHLPVCATGFRADTPNTYSSLGGTSMASPHVAGIAAQMYQADPTLTPTEVEYIIKDTAHKFTAGAPYEEIATNDPRLCTACREFPTHPGSTSFDKGHGLIDALAAVRAVLGDSSDPDPSPSPTSTASPTPPPPPPAGGRTFYLHSDTGTGNADRATRHPWFDEDLPTWQEASVFYDLPPQNGAPQAIYDPYWTGTIGERIRSLDLRFWQRTPAGDALSRVDYTVTIWVGEGTAATAYRLPRITKTVPATVGNATNLIEASFSTMLDATGAEVPLDVDPGTSPVTITIAGDGAASGSFGGLGNGSYIHFDSVSMPAGFTINAQGGADPTPSPTPSPTTTPDPDPSPGASITIGSPRSGDSVEPSFVAAGTTSGTQTNGAQAALRWARHLEGLDAAASGELQRLQAVLQRHAGFLGLLPSPEGAKTLTALFEGRAPATLPVERVPEGWKLEVRDRLYFDPLRLTADRVVDLEKTQGHGPPVPSDSVGIGPGSTLLIYREGTIGICTAAFIFRDTVTGKVYLGTAGHCFLPENEQSTHGTGGTFDPARVSRVRVCVSTCIGGASGLVSGAFGLYPSVTRDLGRLVYARQATGTAQVGHDFGIVEVPSHLWNEIRTDMPMWNGPDTSDTSRSVQGGDVVVHYGNGIGLGEVLATKGRAGIGAGSNSLRWAAAAAASPGDSGSAVNIASADTGDFIEGRWAAGILTHLSAGVSGGFPFVTVGTNTARAIDMARQDAGINLELIHDPAQLEGGGDPDPDPTPTPTPTDPSTAEYSVEVRLLRDSEPLVDWTETDVYDGTSWSHNFSDVPAGPAQLEARLLEDGSAVATDAVDINIRTTERASQISFTSDSDTSGQYTDEASVKARLTDEDESPIEGAEVAFSLFGSDGVEEWTARTDEDGVASISFLVDRKPDDYQLMAEFAGSEGEHTGDFTATSFRIFREDTAAALAVVGQGANRTLEASLVDEDTPMRGVGGVTLLFFADGDLIGEGVTEADGTASFSVPPRYRGGKRQFEVVFEGDDWWRASSAAARS